MTKEQQRVAIAEACGWTCDRDGNWKDANRKYGINGCPPNYLNDLNAMHEAEKSLTREQAVMHGDLLAVECGYGKKGEFNFYDAAHATAAQRAEAFLRTLNLWKETT